MSTHVVIWDPRGEYWEGGLVDGDTVATHLRSRGVATLPVEPEFIGRSAVGGWMKRAWGSGWPISGTAPRLVCPLALYVMRDVGATASARRLSYCARLVPDSPEVLAHAQAGGRLVGMLRLSADTGQPGTHAGGLGVTERSNALVDVAMIGLPDEWGGWTVYGDAAINSPIDGIFGCGLYAAAAGLRVAWAAVSQSR